MPDEVPISRDITDIPVVTSGLDRPENKDLKAAFDAWDPEPVKEEEPPSAPVEKPEEEQLVEASETKQATKPEVDPVAPEDLDEPQGKETDFERRVKRAPTEKEISGEVEDVVHEADEIEALDLDRNASPAQKSQFRQLKNITKKFRQESVELKAKLAPVLQELGVSADDPTALQTLAEKVKALKTAPALPPEERSEIEALRVISRASKLDQSLTYNRGYSQPVRALWSNIIDDLASGMQQTPEVRAWAEDLKTKHNPKAATGEWFAEHLNMIPDGIHRQRIQNKIGQLSELQKSADQVAGEIASNGDLFRQWQALENEQAVQKIKNEFEMAAQRCFQGSHKRLSEWQIKKEDGVTNPKELADIRAHNAKFVQREGRFKQILTNLWSEDRLAATGEALNYIEMEEKYPQVVKENEDLKAEVAKLKRRVGVSRRMEDVPMRSGSGTGGGKSAPEKAKLTSAKQPNWDDL
jgi:hypothetical protein